MWTHINRVVHVKLNSLSGWAPWVPRPAYSMIDQRRLQKRGKLDLWRGMAE